MSATLDYMSALFVWCGTFRNWVLAMAILAARNTSEGITSPMEEAGGVWPSVLCCCVWKETGFSRRENVVAFNSLYKEIT
jgi:hypothetical protein